ncbi:MAG: PAS domain S-box protein [Melioribacteraceae bacterium]|nr:PAS domain S-box protein [Melioribacteraceae bacterium]
MKKKQTADINKEVTLSGYKLSDLINVKEVKQLFELHSNIANLPVGLIDNDDNILIGNEWHTICDRYHSENLNTKNLCSESDCFIKENIGTKKSISCTCKLGFTSIGIPVNVAGKKMGILFLGRFIKKDKNRPADFFSKIAKKYNFDPNDFLATVAIVPQFNNSEVKKILTYYSKLLKIITDQAYKNIILNNESVKNQKLNESLDLKDSQLEHNKHFLKSIFDGANIAIFVLSVDENNDFRFEGLNKAHEKMSGLKSKNVEGKKPEELTDLPPAARKAVKANYTRCLNAGKPIQYKEIITILGKKTHWLTTLTPIKNSLGRIYRIIGTATLIDELVNAQNELESHKKNLEAKIEERTQELVESQERYTLIHEATNQGIWDWNTVTDEIYYSHTWKKQIGYKDNELKNEFETWANHLHPDDKENSFKILEDYLQNPKGKFIVEFRFKHKKGHYVWIHNEAASIKDKSGKVLRMFGAHTDITQEKEAQEKLKESEKKFHNLYDFSPDMYVSVSPTSSNILECNQTLLSATGYTRDEVIGMPIFNMYADYVLPKVEAAFNEFVETGEVKNKELVLKRKDGSFIDVSLNVTSIKDENGNVKYSMSSWRDITAKKIDELRILQEKEFSDAVINAMPGVFYLFDQNGKFVKWNKQLSQLSGIDFDEIGNKSPIDFIVPEDHQKILDAILKAFTDGFVLVEADFLSKEHGSIPFLFTGSRILLNNEYLLLGVGLDISKRKMVENELIDSRRRLSRAIDDSPYPIMIHAEGGEVIQISNSWTALTGYTIEDIPSIETWSAKAYGIRKETIKERIDSLYTLDEKISEGEFEIKCKNGEKIVWEFSSSPIGSLPDNRKLVMSIGNDITQKKIIEEKLAKERAQYLSLFDGIDDIIYVADPENYDLLYVNEAFTKNWDGEIKNRKCFEVLQGKDEPCDFCTNDKILGENFGKTYVWEFQNQVNGTWYRCADKGITWDDGRKVRFELASDITNLKNLEKEKEQAIKSLSERWKEMMCLYQINELLQTGERDFKSLFSKIADLIPFGWKSIENTRAQIHFDNFLFESKRNEIKKSFHKSIESPIIINNQNRGKIVVGLTCNGKSGAALDFLQEERSLLDTIKNSITSYINRIEFEDALLESEEKFRTMLEFSPLSKVIIDLEGNVEYLNKAFADIIGYEHSEVHLVEKWWELAYPDPKYRQEIKTRWDNELALSVSENRSTKPIEARIRCKNGEFRYFSTIGTLIGQKVLVVFSDLTERILAAEKEEKSRKLSESLYELSKQTDKSEAEIIEIALENAVGLTESKGGYLHFINNDDVSLELFKWSAAVNYYCNADKTAHHKLEEAGIWADCIRTGKPVVHNDYPARSDRKGLPEGHFELLRHTSIPIFEANRIVAVCGVGNKETDYNDEDVMTLNLIMNEMWKLISNKRVNEQIRVSEDRFRSVYNDSPVSIWDEDWTEVIEMIQSVRNENIEDYKEYFTTHTDFVNEALLKVKINDVNNETLLMFEAKSKDEMLSSLQTVFSTDDTLPGFINELAALANGKSIFETEMALRTVKGNLIQTLLRMTFPSENENLGQVLVSIMDISKLKETEDKLETTLENLKRSNQELEQFAYVASHDLQEPLRMVASYTQLLARRYKDKLDKDANEFIDYAVDGANRMQTLINDLLEFSRVTTRGKDFRNLDFNDVVQQAIYNLGNKIEETNAEIFIPTLPNLNGDLSQLVRLMQNLLGNGLKYQNEKIPVINVTYEDQVTKHHFKVQDNGIGIAPEYQSRIFEIFERLHTREKYDGTGIGLSICRRIVERHGGTIWVESKLGERAAFHFTISKNL